MLRRCYRGFLSKTSIDVSGDYQLVTLTINATDSTDAAGYDFSYACFKNIEPDGGVGNGSKCPGFNYSNGGADSNGTFFGSQILTVIPSSIAVIRWSLVLPILPGIGFLTMFA